MRRIGWSAARPHDTRRRVRRLGVAAALAAFACAAAEGGASEQGVPATSDLPPEEVIVVGQRPLTQADRQRIYEELAKARELYGRNEIDAALPLLRKTATHGFKESQARMGHIYMQGLGEVEHDSEQAVGWLGVASSGTTAPSIENYFNRIWQRIPERYVPHFEEVVEDYRNRYGERATGVVCRLDSAAHSYLKRLNCYYEEDLPEPVRDAVEAYQDMSDAIDAAERADREALWELEAEMRQRDDVLFP